MMHSAFAYMLLDIGGSLCGTVMFAAVLLIPGYVLGCFSNVLDFRAKSPAEQLAWSVSLSFGMATVGVVALMWLAGSSVTEGLLGLLAAMAAVLFVSSVRQFSVLRVGYLLCACWVGLVVFSLVDIGAGDRLWMSVTTFDHSVRVPFVDAVMRTGVVPVNPLYWPGHDAPLRYYYFWYVLCGIVAKVAHISARQALIGSCVWPALGIAAMLALYGKYLMLWPGTELRNRLRLAIAFMAITGLDVLIALLVTLAGKPAGADMEWWSVDQVSSWLDALLWVPHHVAAVVCCLLCFLLLSLSRDQNRTGTRAALGVLAGISFASAFGLSTYVAAGFCFLVAAWFLRETLKAEGGLHMMALALALLTAVLLLTPYVQQLRRANHSGEKAPHVFSLQVRQMLQPQMLSGLPVIKTLGSHHPFAATQISAFLLLAPGYFIEFGFFAIVLWRTFKRRNKTEGERLLLFLTVIALLSVSFVRSTVIATNDYGSRATLLAQFFLLLLAVPVWQESRRGSRILLAAFALIGIGGTLYQTVLLRTYLIWQQKHGNLKMGQLAERNYALRDAYQQLDGRIPAAGRLQYGAPAGGFFDGTHTLNAQRQIVAAGTTGLECNTGFGGEVSACAPIRKAELELYSITGGVPLSTRDATNLCLKMGAGYLVITRWDGIWQEKASWAWNLPPIVSAPEVRVVACR